MSLNRPHTIIEKQNLRKKMKEFWLTHPQLAKQCGDAARLSFFIEHHLDGDERNNIEINKICLTNLFHKRLHNKAYNYLVKINKHVEYVEWSFKNQEKFFNKEVWNGK